MKTKPESEESGLKPITIRIEPSRYAFLKEYADSRRTSLNTVVSEAIAQYEAKLTREQTIKELEAFQQRIRDAHGVGYDSVELLREMRGERIEHMAPTTRRPTSHQRGGKRP